MHNWLKHWRDWAMREFWWLLQRHNNLRITGIYCCYEKAGIVVRNEPIPWNADAVLVEVLVRFPNGAVRRKSDFSLRSSALDAVVPASSLQRRGAEDCFVVLFRFCPIRELSSVEVLWRDRPVVRTAVPTVSPTEFLAGLRIEQPTTFARLGDYTVPCRAIPIKQCTGLLAAALLQSSTSLLPLADLDLHVEFMEYPRTAGFGGYEGRNGLPDDRLCEPGGNRYVVPVRLTGSQLARKEAQVIVAAPRPPKRIGVWAVSWKTGRQTLARTEVRILGKKALARSLYLADSRYVHQDKLGRLNITKVLPALGPGERLGPCFLIASREEGLAALCALEVVGRQRGQALQPLDAQQVLVTDVPMPLAPGTVSEADLQNLIAFELRQGNQVLGAISTCPAPTATFTSEGGFKPPPEDHPWSPASDEELNARLQRLSSAPG